MTALTDRILEARHIACQHRSDGNDVMAEIWDENVNKLLDQLHDEPAHT